MSLILVFTNVGPNLANDITEPDENISIYDYLGESIEQSLFMRPVDEEEVITTVTGCTKKRSSDFEDISMDTVAKVVSVICKPLAHICNISFRTGVFPSRMKIAKVIPMFKSGTKTDVTNHRPISLLPQFSKILEKKISYQNKQLFMCQQHFKFESIRVPHKFVYVTGGDGID